MLCGIFSRRQTDDIFLSHFSEKISFDISCKLSRSPYCCKRRVDSLGEPKTRSLISAFAKLDTIECFNGEQMPG